MPTPKFHNTFRITFKENQTNFFVILREDFFGARKRYVLNWSSTSYKHYSIYNTEFYQEFILPWIYGAISTEELKLAGDNRFLYVVTIDESPISIFNDMMAAKDEMSCAIDNGVKNVKIHTFEKDGDEWHRIDI